jgi:transposase
LKGTPCRVVQTSKRSEKWSILPAIRINGYLDYDIFQDNINTNRFTFFIRQLLRKINKYPGPRLILIINNFGTHLPEDLKEMCEKAEVDLMYLTPYSPDLSPIKESFNGLKQWMRRNRALSLYFEGIFKGFFHLVIKLAITPEDVRGYFRSTRISITKED